MKTSELIKDLTYKGYNIAVFDTDNNFGHIYIIKAEKGKLIKQKLMIFVIDSYNDEFENEIIDFINQNNKNNNLCIVLCNTIRAPKNKSIYMNENKKGISIIHFVYYSVEDNSFTYDLDFNYYQSKIVKSIIIDSIKKREPFRTGDGPSTGT